VSQLEQKNYAVTFINKTHQLELSINGEEQAWVTLDYDHPTRKVSQVHNTKHAKGTLTLMRLKDAKNLAKLMTSGFELETLIAAEE
jgi:hypothetical protein